MSALVGFTCAYTPLPLVHAAGLVPYRVLPEGDSAEQAGTLLHDNLCPHVKRVLDRVLGDEVPELAGVVLMQSCDAMRRLADAWRAVRPDQRLVEVDLPVQADARSARYFALRLEALAHELATWSGTAVTDDALARSLRLYDELAAALERVRRAAADGTLPGGWPAAQTLGRLAVTGPPDAALAEVRRVETTVASAPTPRGVPVYLFGNVMADPAAYALLAECGAHVVGDDLCTGGRQLQRMPPEPGRPPLERLAEVTLGRAPCARTLPTRPADGLGPRLLAAARTAGARGVVAHVLKFCDPFLARLPGVRATLREGGLPLLVLEGDCTLRSLGQQRTRLQAFVEMLAESGP